MAATFVALAYFSVGIAFAAQPGSAQQQKLQLVAKLLDGSPTAARVDASDHNDAKAALRNARALYAQAVKNLGAGDTVLADRALNQALTLIGKARTLVPDPAVVTQAQQFRYGQLIASIESVQVSYLHHLGHSKVRTDHDLRWLAISRLVDSARNYAGRGSFAEANQLLIRAEADLLAALESVLGRKTIEYAHHFAGPQEEFTHEFTRNGDYRDLVPLALSELKPAANAASRADHHLNAGLVLRDQAAQLASNRDFNGALEVIRRSTSEMQRALLAAGLVVPGELP